MTKKQPTFEEALKRLGVVITELEDPEVTLDQTLALFQEGKRLSELCHRQLTAVERKISKLLEKEEGRLELEEFEEEEEEE